MPTEDGELQWLRHVDHKNNSYLCLINQSGKTIKKGEQVMFFYGKYTSAYLLLNYGFCYKDNKYDQVDMSLEMRPQSNSPEHIICFDRERVEDIQEVHLKADKLNETLVYYLRLLIQTETLF